MHQREMKAYRMTITQISAWIMLVSCGLWAGGILIFAVERTNLWRRMPIDQYVVDFRRSLFRVDPMMPILGVIAGGSHPLPVANSQAGFHALSQQCRSFDYAACLNDKLAGERKSNGLSRNKVYVQDKRCRKLDR